MKAPVQQSDGTQTMRIERPVEAQGSGWTFLTNHSHVLICLSQEPQLRLRDVAERVGITERAVQRIIADLEGAGILTRSRDGRRNTYEIHAGEPLRHPIEAHCKISDLLRIVEPPEGT
jgi:DNA-binding IscR family transcriptional regulator